MEAKLDTGADNSAIHALNITQKRRNGENWVSFDVITKTGRLQRFEKPVVRIAHIKRRSGPAEKRPVVMLTICLGTIKRDVEVGLVNREHFNFRFLVGRSFLKGFAVVDSAKEFSTLPDCP